MEGESDWNEQEKRQWNEMKFGKETLRGIETETMKWNEQSDIENEWTINKKMKRNRETVKESKKTHHKTTNISEYQYHKDSCKIK